jgi:multidrug efflux pump subunit AcrB
MKRLLVSLISALGTGAVAGDGPGQAQTLVSVRTDVNGASAEDVESKVTAPLEEVLFRLRSARLIQSRSSSGRSVIEFQVDQAQACEALTVLSLAIADVRETLLATTAVPVVTMNPDIRCK